MLPTGDYIMHLEVGMDAPQFELADAEMEMFKLTSWQAKKNIAALTAGSDFRSPSSSSCWP